MAGVFVQFQLWALLCLLLQVGKPYPRLEVLVL